MEIGRTNLVCIGHFLSYRMFSLWQFIIELHNCNSYFHCVLCNYNNTYLLVLSWRIKYNPPLY